jgi:hypothetical protein
VIITLLYMTLVSIGAAIGFGIGYGWGYSAGTENGFTLARIAQDKQREFWNNYEIDQNRRMKSATR